MNVFVIAKKNSQFLDTPVFRAGQSGSDEAIAVFTTHDLASKYISDAGWASDYEVGELQPIQLVRWLAVASEDGTDMAVVNPDCNQHLGGVEQRVVYLDEPFTAFANLISTEILKHVDES